jgi:hypothetical protein
MSETQKRRYICPECEKPYTPTKLLRHFPRHGRKWVVRPRGQVSGWQCCDGSDRPITQFSQVYAPKRPKG